MIGWLNDLLQRFQRDGDPRARRAALFAYAIRFGNAGLLFVLQVVLARWMGEFEYGIFVLVWTWMTLLGIVASLGFGTGILRLISEYRVAGNFRKLRGLLAASRGLGMAVATVIALAGAGLVLGLGDIVRSYYVAPVLLGFICLPMFALAGVQDGIGRSFDFIGIALVPLFIVRPLLLLVLVVGAVAFGAPSTAETALLAAIAASWISVIGQYLALRRRLAAEVPAGGRSYDVPVWLRVSVPVLLVDGFAVVVVNTDVLVLSLFVTPDQVGPYYAAAKLLALVSIVHYAVAVAVAHRYAAFYASGDRDGLEKSIRNAAGLSFWPSLAATVGILVLGYPLLSLFGPAFTQAYPVTFILAVGVLARASMGPSERLLNVIGEQDRCARIYFTVLVVNICLNVIAIPLFGIMGAAAATSIAITYESFLLNRAVKGSLGVSAFVLAARMRQPARR